MIRLDHLPTHGVVDVIARPRHTIAPFLQQRSGPVVTDEQVLAFHARELARGKRHQQWRCDQPTRACVTWNTGWMCECPSCHGGVAVDPEHTIACCLECGAVLTAVAIPAEWREIEAVLLKRPDVRTRGWWPGETVDDLRAENRAHGVPD